MVAVDDVATLNLTRQAEVNLVFNQLLFDLEAEVFGYFKDWAASTVLDKTFKKVYEIRRGWGHFIPGRRRYEVLQLKRLLVLLSRMRTWLRV